MDVQVRGFAPGPVHVPGPAFVHAFVPAPSVHFHGTRIDMPHASSSRTSPSTTSPSTTRLNLSQTSSSLPNVDTMKARELREELQSYGISTKSFLEKSELVDAVQKARAEGKTKTVTNDKDKDKDKDRDSTSSSSDGSASSSTTTSTTSDGGKSKASREERLKEEMAKCQTMKVGDLKKELQSYGVNTKSFFEKSEFVRAVAEARVDGKSKTNSSASSASAGSSSSSSSSSEEEPYDPSYRDVIMRKMTDDPRMLGGGPLIDIRLG